jgi:capsular polysaccharide transport system permease protein
MATDETLLVNEYVVSRDVVRLLATNNDLRAILSRSEADPFVRFPNFYSRDDFEHLYWHFHRVIDVYLDQSAGITTLTTYAHRPEDARALAVAVMGYAEALINRLNDRAHEDALRYAQKTVDKTREKVADVQARLTEFRNSHGLVDPGRESAAALQTIEQLSEDQARLEAALGRQSALTPANPGNQGIRRQIDAYKTEIDKLKKQVVGTATSTAAALSAFESLVLERDIAAQSLQAAILNFEQARKQAQDERLYIETITAPHLSDYAEYPKRALDLMIVALVAVGFWLIVRSLRISAMEHAV